MRKLLYYVASTLDGYIAHEDGSIDGFLGEGDHVQAYLESLQTWFDVVIMGRKTYEFGLQFGVTNPYPHLKQYVISRTMQASPDEHVELVSDHVVELVHRLKQELGKDIYLCGGADLATMLLEAEMIDEIILKVSPVLFGSGIPLFSGSIKQTHLQFIDNTVYESGVVVLHYAVVYGDAGG